MNALKTVGVISSCGVGEYGKVISVIDGDTVIVEGGHRVRLLEIDADERDEVCYDSAKSRLAELVLHKEVRLEKDISEVDKYQRCLRTLFISDKNINMELVVEGQAVTAFYNPDIKYKKEMLVAQAYAKEHGLGCEWR